MKRTIISFIFAVALLLPSVNAWAQGASIVYDPTSFGGILKQIYTEIQNHADNIAMSADQIAAIEAVFDETGKVYQSLDNVYNKVQPVLANTKVLYTAGQAIQDNYSTLAWMYDRYATLFSSNDLDYAKFNSALLATNAAARIVKDDYDMISNCLNSAMSAKEKLDLINEIKTHSNAVVNAQLRRLKSQMDSLSRTRMNDEFNRQLNAMAFGDDKKVRSGTLLEMPDLSTDIYSTDDDLSIEGAQSNIRSRYGAVYNLVLIIIGILFIISLAWGGAKYFKGDSQNQDVLFKIAGGLFFILVILQVVKTVLLQ